MKLGEVMYKESQQHGGENSTSSSTSNNEEGKVVDSDYQDIDNKKRINRGVFDFLSFQYYLVWYLSLSNKEKGEWSLTHYLFSVLTILS